MAATPWSTRRRISINNSAPSGSFQKPHRRAADRQTDRHCAMPQ